VQAREQGAAGLGEVGATLRHRADVDPGPSCILLGLLRHLHSWNFLLQAEVCHKALMRAWQLRRCVWKRTVAKRRWREYCWIMY
jgi:hypothetical protein